MGTGIGSKEVRRARKPYLSGGTHERLERRNFGEEIAFVLVDVGSNNVGGSGAGAAGCVIFGRCSKTYVMDG